MVYRGPLICTTFSLRAACIPNLFVKQQTKKAYCSEIRVGAMVQSVFTQEGIYSNLLIISTSRESNIPNYPRLSEIDSGKTLH